MVLDCGGGTIDITSHLVESSDPLQLSELAEPCGGAWGSSIVDSRFKAFLQVQTDEGSMAVVEAVVSNENATTLLQHPQSGLIPLLGEVLNDTVFP